MSSRFVAAALVIQVLMALSIAIAATPSIAANEIVERCGLGPPPDSLDFNRYSEERERVRAQLGYEPVCDQSIATIPPQHPLQSLENVLPKLAFQPIPLDGTPFAAYRLLGARPDITGDERGASALRRYFAGPNGEFYELLEWDQSLGGGTYVLDPKRQSERVKGQLAVLTIAQSKSGKALSVLSWEDNRRHIELSINRNVRQGGYAHFMRLAESMPTPVPAEPNAPRPDLDLPPPFGPGPAFPTHPPK